MSNPFDFEDFNNILAHESGRIRTQLEYSPERKALVCLLGSLSRKNNDGQHDQDLMVIRDALGFGGK